MAPLLGPRPREAATGAMPDRRVAISKRVSPSRRVSRQVRRGASTLSRPDPPLLTRPDPSGLSSNLPNTAGLRRPVDTGERIATIRWPSRHDRCCWPGTKRALLILRGSPRTTSGLRVSGPAPASARRVAAVRAAGTVEAVRGHGLGKEGSLHRCRPRRTVATLPPARRPFDRRPARLQSRQIAYVGPTATTRRTRCSPARVGFLRSRVADGTGCPPLGTTGWGSVLPSAEGSILVSAEGVHLVDPQPAGRWVATMNRLSPPARASRQKGAGLGLPWLVPWVSTRMASLLLA